MQLDWLSVAKTALELGFGALSFLAVLAILGWHFWKLASILNSLLMASQQLVEAVKELKQQSNAQHDLLVEHSTVGDRVIEVVLAHGQKIEGAQGCLTMVKNEIAGMKEFCRSRKG